MFFALLQAEEELKELTQSRDEADDNRKLVLEKAETFMTNTRQKQGLEWDGLRIKSKHTLEQLTKKVRSEDSVDLI